VTIDKQTEKSENIFIFVRRFNDVDHLVPIVYKLKKVTNYNIHLLSLNPLLDIYDDERILFLKEAFPDLTIDYIYSYSSSYFKEIISKLFFTPYKKKKFKAFFWVTSKIIPKLTRDHYSRFIQKIYNRKWAVQLISKHKPAILIFDWVKKYQYCAGPLIDAAEELGIPKVAVPHGLNLSVTDHWTDSTEKYGNFDQLLGHFNKVVMPYEGQKDWYIKNNFPEEKLKVIGSTRYCSEWMKIYRSFAINNNNKYFSNGSNLKVVFMEYPYNYRIDEEIVSQDITSLSEINGVELIIKPHTRANKVYSEKLLNSKIKIDTQTPSIKLIAQADVVIGTTSSIFLDVLLNNVAFIYPKYFHKNIMLYETMNACWLVDNRQELVDAIETLLDDPKYRPYDLKSINNLKNYVVDGSGSEDVLGRYTDFILQTVHQTEKEI
tara:strand:+ start:1520 stop:2818 length:1299 start_codon:yes stop_codon:yes gene_type:complete